MWWTKREGNEKVIREQREREIRQTEKETINERKDVGKRNVNDELEKK